MEKYFMGFVAAAALLLGGIASAEIVQDRDYKVVASPQPPANRLRIEVLNFFSYSCQHCYHLHQQMTAWEETPPEDVNLVFVPTIFNESLEPLARTFYALDTLNSQELSRKFHPQFFRALHVESADLTDANNIGDFLATRGVDRTRFVAAYNSTEVQGKIDESNQLVQRFSVRGTPTLIVDGKYVISELGPEETVRVLTELLDMVRKDRPQQTMSVAAGSRQAAAHRQATSAAQNPVSRPAKLRTTSSASRPATADLRYCLDLGSNAEIAHCAGE